MYEVQLLTKHCQTNFFATEFRIHYVQNRLELHFFVDFNKILNRSID